MSDTTKAVFLSYASQDVEAAKRICEALRAAGVEVWFDQSELVGGDQWDGKIRGQISSCALFVPVISANTQARLEGYFRLEWKLAAQRTHTMADEKTFLLPILIDGTRDAEAKVPAEFKAVQWTKLPGGETPPAFCARVKKLLDGSAVGASLDDARGRAQGTPLQNGTENRRGPGRWWWALPIFGVAMALVLVLKEKREAPPATSNPPPPTSSAPAAPAVNPLVARAWTILRSEVGTKEGLDTAQDLCRQAIARDSTDAEAWAAAAEADALVVYYGIDASEERRQQAQQKAARALVLAPDSFDARHAQAMVFGNATGSQPMREEGAKCFRALIAEQPANRDLKTELGTILRDLGQFDEAAALFEQVDDLGSAGWNYITAGRYADAQRVADKWLQKRGHNTGALLLQYVVKVSIAQDLAAAHEIAAQFTTTELLEDGAAMCAMYDGLYRRDAAAVIRVLTSFPREHLASSGERGPKRYFLGLAHEIAGNTEAARSEWRLALEQVRERQKATPNDLNSLGFEAVLQARLGERAESERLLVLFRSKESDETRRSWTSVLAWAALGQGGKVRADVEAWHRDGWRSFESVHAALRFSPEFDVLRSEAWFGKFLRDTLPPAAKPFDDPKPAVTTIPVADDKSLVVLPLENLSPDPENAFFTEGMHAEIIATLQRATDLRVIGRDSALALKRGSGSLAELAARVGAANVMTGSVRRSGTKVLILLELRRARDEALLWSSPNTVRELGADIFGLQAEVAREVVRVLQARESKGWGADAEFRTSNAQALDLFLKAQQIFRSNFATTRDTRMPAAIALMEEALRLDPHFVSAMQWLSTARVDRYRYSLNLHERAVHAAEAKRWAEAAAREVSGGAGDSALYFYSLMVEKDPVRALALNDNFIRAVPNDASGWNGRGLIMTQLGRFEETIAAYDRSILLDPLWVVTRINKYIVLARQRHRIEAEAMLPEILPLLEDRTQPTDTMIQAQYCLTGEPAPVGRLSISRQVAWLALFRKPAEQLALVERELATPNLDEGTEFYWRRYQCEALQRLGRAAEADQSARRMLVLAENIEGMPAVDPIDKQRQMARALLATRQMKEAAAAAQRALEIDRRRGIMTQLWTDQAMLAEIYAQAGQKAECLGLLRELLQVPGGLTVPTLRTAPMWDPIRDDPEFQALLNDPKNNAPL